VLPGVVATGGRAHIVDGAVARVRVEELADATEVFVRLPVEQALVTVVGVEEAPFCLLQRKTEVLCNAHGVPLGHLDDRIGAAITGHLLQSYFGLFMVVWVL
jgi:hypothetical protein